MIITIDGPAATGKSTVARQLAQSIGYIFFDTGAMYRAVAYGILNNKIDPQNEAELTAYLNSIHFEIRMKKGEHRYYLNGTDVTDIIRTAAVTKTVSEVSALKPIREKLCSIQRDLSKGVNSVFEGRDMGTTVFPQAPVKIFLSANPEVRAKRRYDELKAKYSADSATLTYEECLTAINERDLRDTTRAYSPLKQAPDAYVIDTSELSPEEVVSAILEYKDSIKARKGKISE